MPTLANTLARCGCFIERRIACVTIFLFFVMTVVFVWQEYYGLSSFFDRDLSRAARYISIQAVSSYWAFWAWSSAE